MKRKILLFCFFMFYSISFVTAITSDLEADVFYKSAEGYMRDGQYESALMSVYRAREIYVELENTWGIQRCDKLIASIEDILQPVQLANIYYNIAGDYFLVTQDDIDVLDRVIDMANRAKTIYQTIGGSVGSTGKLKCDDLIQRAIAKRDDIWNQCVRGGDELLQKAQDSFFLGQYTLAKAYAVNASKKYVSCPYQAGIDTSASLLTSVNAKIDDLRMQAKASYEKAIEYYAQNDKDGQERCIQYAIASREIYQKLDDEEGYSSATALATRCTQDKIAGEEEKLREAREYFEEAKRLSIIPDCINSTDRANKAKAIYQQFYTEALREEAPSGIKLKSKLYYSYISEVNSLLAKIMEACNSEQMLKIAEDFYRKSQDFYLDNNIQEALTYVNNARGLFAQFKNYVGISKCDTLIGQINIRVNQRNEAEAYLKNAQKYYNVADFQIAIIEANKARKIYSVLYDNNNIKRVDVFLTRVSNGIKQLEEANNHYNEAQNYFELRDYNSAIPSAEKANSIYNSINYTLGISESRNILTKSQEELDKEQTEFINNVILFGVLFILSAVLIVQFLGRKKAMEKEYKQRVADEDEKTRRHDEEWSLRTEEDTKSKVEDELRKLVDSERNKIDET